MIIFITIINQTNKLIKNLKIVLLYLCMMKMFFMNKKYCKFKSII